MKRVVILSSASGSGKSTLGRRLAALLGVPYVELDAIHHQAGWRELTAEELRREVEPIVAGDAWVIDGAYRGKLGHLTLDRADTVVWLDLPRTCLAAAPRPAYRAAASSGEKSSGTATASRSATCSSAATR